MVPMVFAAFANDISRSLDLMKERDMLRKIYNDNKRVELKILENATYEYISDTIINEKLQDRIAIFHYAGHSDGKNIKLLDGDVQTAGLAKLLNSFTNLQLIFLNGCDNYEQVNALQKENVTAAVIATVKPLNDAIAVDFAYHFHYPFYSSYTLNDAFKNAEARILSGFSSDRHHFQIDRGIGLSEAPANYQSLESVYVLAAAKESSLTERFHFDVDYQEPNNPVIDYKPNWDLIESLAESIINGSYPNETFKKSNRFEGFESLYKNFCQNKNNRNFGELGAEVMNLLPSPLRFHVNLLLANGTDWPNQNNNKKIELLKRQIITYNSLTQILSFTMLSSFWNELLLKDLAVSESQWKILKNFLAPKELNNQDINYPALLVTIREIFEKNELTPFITEYKDIKKIFETEEDFFEMHLYMQGLKSIINNSNTGSMDFDWHCNETEKKLCVIMSKSGFVIRYKLTTIKQIEISKSRLKTRYYIKRIILDGSKIFGDDVEQYDESTDSLSVILARGVDKDTFTKFLTLSPFIIDENALKGENLSKLFFFSHRDDNNNYVYKCSDNPAEELVVKSETYAMLPKTPADTLKVINERLSAVRDEMKAFEILINSK